MSKVRVVNFEPTSKGENTHLYIIENNSGASVTLCDLGASVVSIKVPDKNGSIRDVVLGYEHIDGYEFDGTYFGATVGRCCGRIAYGKFTLNGEDYQLPVNNGSNHLHGGFNSFSRKVWLAVVDDKVPNTVLFVLNHSDEEFVLAAEAEGIDSGITLKCYTSQKGVHVYTANYVDVLSNMGKDSATYGENPAFCLETQGFPDAVNHKNFPTTILKANENYTQTTKYIFGINK